MPIYSYKCSAKIHQQPVIFDRYTMGNSPLGLAAAPCPQCQRPAQRYYPGQSVSGYWPTRSDKLDSK